MRGTGRHRKGRSGLTWCRVIPSIAAALARPEIARRGLFERLFSVPRHVGPVLAVA